MSLRGAKTKMLWQDPEYRERMIIARNRDKGSKKTNRGKHWKIKPELLLKRKDKPSNFKGKKHTEQAKNKNRIAHLGKNVGEDNWIWKGNEVGYRTLHRWVERHLGHHPPECQQCGKIGEATGRVQKHWNIQWANLSHKYKRILTDWMPMCVKCHAAYDSKKHPQKIY